MEKSVSPMDLQGVEYVSGGKHDNQMAAVCWIKPLVEEEAEVGAHPGPERNPSPSRASLNDVCFFAASFMLMRQQQTHAAVCYGGSASASMYKLYIKQVPNIGTRRSMESF